MASRSRSGDAGSRAQALLLHGDMLDALAAFDGSRFTLAYLDPPFSVGTPFHARTKKDEVRAAGRRSSGPVAYVDKFPSIDAYVAWLEPRLAACRDVLTEQGSLWLHLDHRAVHEAKIACDRVFGRANAVGEVIWVPGNGSKARRGPGATHQTLLVYARTKDYIWNADDPALRTSYAATSLSMHFTKTDSGGRRYRERTIGGKTYRYYADEGRAIGSVWDDCPSMSCNTPLRKETTGYPTQKPLRLLDRIVRASTRVGDEVLDPCFGSGTTLVAAILAGRRATGIDIGELAHAVARKRLENEGIRFLSSAREQATPKRARPNRQRPRRAR